MSSYPIFQNVLESGNTNHDNAWWPVSTAGNTSLIWVAQPPAYPLTKKQITPVSSLPIYLLKFPLAFLIAPGFCSICCFSHITEQAWDLLWPSPKEHNSGGLWAGCRTSMQAGLVDIFSTAATLITGCCWKLVILWVIRMCGGGCRVSFDEFCNFYSFT